MASTRRWSSGSGGSSMGGAACRMAAAGRAGPAIISAASMSRRWVPPHRMLSPTQTSVGVAIRVPLTSVPLEESRSRRTQRSRSGVSSACRRLMLRSVSGTASDERPTNCGSPAGSGNRQPTSGPWMTSSASITGRYFPDETPAILNGWPRSPSMRPCGLSP